MIDLVEYERRVYNVARINYEANRPLDSGPNRRIHVLDFGHY